MEQYKNTLIKLINISNMSEVQGTLEDITNDNIILSDSIIVVNRGVADLAGTVNDIIQYKYNGDQLGSTIASPLGPLFKNMGEKSVVFLNKTNWVYVPLVSIDTVNKKPEDRTIDEQRAMKLIESMIDYIGAVNQQFIEIADYFDSDSSEENDIS